MTTARDSSSRLRQALNPLLTTSLGGFSNQLNTPHSAVSVATPYYSTANTPASSIQPYNPQEWGASPAVSHDRAHLSFHEAQVSSPPPPPPYSPPRSQRPVSGAFEASPANISAARAPFPGAHRPSPEPANTQSFPPPPNAGGRGVSRERRFLSSLRRSREPTESTTPSEPVPPIPMSRSQPQPLRLDIPPTMPPNSRRAASASAVETPTSARSRSASQSRWEPGMPLPPPPPGPPPSTSRSQSLNRVSEPITSPPTRRPPPGGVTALGPIPPTPADWIDRDQQPKARSPQPGLSIDTSSAASSSSSSQAPPESALECSPSSGGLMRQGAVRGEKTLRERRSESRTGHNNRDSIVSIQPLSDILVPQGSNVSRRFSAQKGTPRNASRAPADSPWSGQNPDGIDSRHTTPRPHSGMHVETPTPPFSPQPQKAYPATEAGHPFAPRALPTPPPQSRSASSSSARPDMQSTAGSIVMGPSSSIPLSKPTAISQTADQFCKGTIERFQAFAQKEAAAASDADRVKLFADFIVSESRIRRERYNSAIGAMGSEIFDLTRDLFRPMSSLRRDSSTSQGSEWTPQMSETMSHRNSVGSIFGREGAQQSNSAPASANIPTSPAGGTPNNANWSSNYMPSLSPILSMTISDAPDESSSRGRPSSRWWEADSTGDASNRLERSKRESKYMGVPKEAREALQWRDPPSSSSGHASSSHAAPSSEYPAEKVGWHESDSSSTPHASRNSLLSSLSVSTPNTPSPTQLDVSRLVTLPPPYPRHHPAVNNNHPELTEIRTLVRSISDLRELKETKDRFTNDSRKMREEAADAAKQRRQSLRVNLQQEINSGNMTYAEAAAIEADSREGEKAQTKEIEKKDFERFQTAVVMPLNEALTERIAKATSLFDELRSRLFVETQASNPNMPQEEGDEQPELLEKLTLLKWIFEAREMLHREIYDLLTDRNDRYKEVVCTPYRMANNEEKLQNAVAFFREDAQKRQVEFSNEVLQRTREFRSVVAQNVERGVEMQLNAFWDIAPPLKRLLDKIPAHLDFDFHIHIPPSEYDENPEYHRHPLQYLYSLLLHAEKSTYQFIESQTNLLCLLHEVKEAVVVARAKFNEAEGCLDPRAVEERRAAEQAGLTDDLKDKVRLVQEQWGEAMGEAIRGVKERVGEWLLSTGGWDESLEDGGVGGV